MSEFFKRHHVSLSVVFAAVFAVVVMFLMPSVESAGAASLSAASLALAVMRFVVAVACVFVVLRVLDAVAQFDWEVISNDIEGNPRSAALYLGLRFVAVAWIASQCFS